VGFEKEEWQPGKHHLSILILTRRADVDISQGKAARAEYNRSLSALEQALRVALHTHTLRFAPLGVDHEGRTYFALTPSMAEREAAAALLAGDTSKGGKAHGRAIISTDERGTMRRWGWFIAVWGQKPVDGLVPACEEDDDSDDDSDDDDDTERWWGLWHADEIRKLADWIAIKNGCAGGKEEDEDERKRARARTEAESSGARSSQLTPLLSEASSSDTDDEAAAQNGEGGRAIIPTLNELEALVGALRECAEVLDWRAWRMEEEPGADDKENGVAKKTKAGAAQIRAVPPANFYGR
jgi:hypothetical protein